MKVGVNDLEDLACILSQYRKMMMLAKTDGDMKLHEKCVQITRELTVQIKEKTVCS